MKYTVFDSVMGRLLAATDAKGLRYLHFLNGRDEDHDNSPMVGDWQRDDHDSVLVETRRQLEEYFLGTRQAFDLPLAPAGTAFQQKAWQALLDIPYGSTASYREQAVRIGNVKAVRAVGLANGRNPIAIVVPCHRVIGSDGSLTGYAGGLPIKRALLELEGALPQRLLV